MAASYGAGCSCWIGSASNSICGSATAGSTTSSAPWGISLGSSAVIADVGLNSLAAEISAISGAWGMTAGEVSAVCSTTGPTDSKSDSAGGGDSRLGSAVWRAAACNGLAPIFANRSKVPLDFAVGKAPRRNEGLDAASRNETWRGPPKKPLPTPTASPFSAAAIRGLKMRELAIDLICKKLGTLNVWRRNSGTITQAKRKTPANSNPPTSHVCRLIDVTTPGCEIPVRPSFVADVAAAAAPDGFVSPAAAC